MKVCTKCGGEKPVDDFARNRSKPDGRQAWCKSCLREYDKARYREKSKQLKQQIVDRNRRHREAIREYLLEYLTEHPCVACGEADPVVLDFDHVRGKKKASVAYMAGAGGYSLETIQAEIEKCEVRCANCHRRKTAKERGHFRFNRTTGSSEARASGS